jgi:hypothetical protein
MFNDKGPVVMAGFMPAIEGQNARSLNVTLDGQDEPGHDSGFV